MDRSSTESFSDSLFLLGPINLGRAGYSTILIMEKNKLSLIQGLHHVGLVVEDLNRMVKFYTQELGLTVLRRMKSVAPVGGDHTGIPGADRDLIFVGVEGIYQIELVHYKNPPAKSGYLDKHQLGASHICFNVINLRETYRILVEKGVHFITEPKFRSWEKSGELGIVYAQDPEGNWLEFVQGLGSSSSKEKT